MDGLFPIGFFTGMSVSGILKKQLGFEAVFAFGICGAILAFSYAFFFIKDSRKLRPKEVLDELEALKVRRPCPVIDILRVIL